MSLSEPHRQTLEVESGITPDVIEARGYRTVETQAELKRLGFSDSQRRVPALLIPIHDVYGQIRTYQSRPDSPRISDGKAIKYETPKGSHMALDVHPAIRHRLGDPHIPLWITEGIKKGDSLVSRGCCAVALLGVWNWRGTNAHGGRTVLSDWDSIALNNRLVYIVFDSDAMTKRQVHAALNRLGGVLKDRQADVRFVYLPGGESGSKVGVDDYLVQGHAVDDLVGISGPGGPGGPSSTLEQQEALDRPKNASGPGGPEFPTVPGYRITEDGVSEVPEDPNKPEIRLTLAPCGVLAHCRDGARQNWGAFLRWRDRDGQPHEGAFPVGRFHESGGTLPVDLANAGLPIMPGMEKKLLRYLANGNPNTRYRAAIQTGWQEETGVFVLPCESLGGTAGCERVVYQPDRYSPTTQSVRTAGTCEDWKSTVAAPCAENPVLVFWLSSSLAAPLLHLLGLEGGGFHLYGLTSQGKTTADQVAASVWGDGTDPAEGRLTAFVKKWNLTKNATEGLAEAHNDLPLCLDEVSEADAREFGRMIYQLAGGQGKGRMRADTTLKQSKVWRILLLSTGEVPTADVIQLEGRRLKGGQAVRLVDIPATDPTGQGILVNTHGFSSPAGFADGLKRACATHYGWAGPAFVQTLICEGIESVRLELRIALEEIRAALCPPDAQPEVARISKRLAIAVLAGEKATTLGLLPWEKGEAFRAARAMLERHLAFRDGRASDTERAIDHMKDFLLAHASSRFRELSKDTDRVMNLAGYRDMIADIFYFTPQGFREACGGHDVKEVARLLKERSFLQVSDSGHLTERVSVPGVGRTRLYTVLAGILDGELVSPGPLDRSTI